MRLPQRLAEPPDKVSLAANNGKPLNLGNDNLGTDVSINQEAVAAFIDLTVEELGDTGCDENMASDCGDLHSPETKSYARKTVIRRCLQQNKMPNTTWKNYARNRNSVIHQ